MSVSLDRVLARDLGAKLHSKVTRSTMKVREVMEADVPIVSSDESATTAWERMRESHVDYLIVTRGEEILGTLSWQDLSGPLGGAHRRMGRRVGDLMNRDVVTASPGITIARAAASMRRRRVGCLAIVERNKLIGLVTTSDMLGILASQ